MTIKQTRCLMKGWANVGMLNIFVCMIFTTYGCATKTVFSPSSWNTTTAGEIYHQFYTIKTNLMAASSHNMYPAYAISEIDPDIKARLEFDPAVVEFFFVDPLYPGRCYGCTTNTVFHQIGEEPITNRFSRGVAWIIPVGNECKKALFLMSSIAPKQTIIVLFESLQRGRLVYDSNRKPELGGIDYLCGVEVSGRNHFLLHEGWIPSISQASGSPRNFRLEVDDKSKIDIWLQK